MKNQELHFETFTPGFADGKADNRTRNWVQAVNLAFNLPSLSSDAENRTARHFFEANSVLTQVIPLPALPFSDNLPVATFGFFPGTVNLGDSNLARAGLITEVTVRPTHKRRGIMSRLMKENLARIHSAGMPLALLTASEATIYHRFGFAPVVWKQTVTIDRAPKFSLRCKTSGTVAIVDLPSALPSLPEIFTKFHSHTLGSVSRIPGYYEQHLWNDSKDEIEPKHRLAMHFSEQGEPDGFILYYYENEWAEAKLMVVDLVGASPEVEMSLWNFLAETDLSKTIKATHFQPGSALPLALVDPRVLKVEEVEDGLWARVLDPIACLTTRGYTLAAKNSQLSLTIKIKDKLGFATGIFKITLDSNGAQVTRTDSIPEIELGVAAFSQLIFGAVSAKDLHTAGQLKATDPGAIDIAQSLFAPVSSAQFISHF